MRRKQLKGSIEYQSKDSEPHAFKSYRRPDDRHNVRTELLDERFDIHI